MNASVDEEALRAALISSLGKSLADIACVALEADRDRANSWGFAKSFEVYDRCDQRTKEKVLGDPRMVAAVENAQRRFGELGIEYLTGAEWENTLAALGRLGLAVSVLTKSPISLPIRIEAVAQFAIPGTNYLLKNRDKGAKVVRVEVDLGGNPTVAGETSVSFETLPDINGFQLAYPEALLSPPRDLEHLLSNEEINGSDWQGWIASATELLARHEESYALAIKFGWIIVPIRDERTGVQSSVSFDSLPGAIFTSWCDDPRMLAETLVHESDHQRHYLLTRILRFWEDDPTNQSPVYRSPWRDDPRPLDGILRGASAFASVSELWTHLLTTNSQSSSGRYWVGERAVLTSYQCIDALITLRKFAKFTRAGTELVRELSERVTQCRDILRADTNFGEWIALASEGQSAHDQRWQAVSPSAGEFGVEATVDGYTSFAQ